MRQIVLDTETTGLDVTQGHRVIEIGCVELVNRRLTERRFHHYLCPDRDIDPGAEEVHGISGAFLEDKPRFGDIAGDFVDFIKGAELVIHNAAFDEGFINNELALTGGPWKKLCDYCTVTDSLALARKRHPGQKNSLDALCARYKVDNSQREQHGALLDAEILADVYLAMTGGQATLALSTAATVQAHRTGPGHSGDRVPLRVIHATEAESALHEARLDAIERESAGHCLWRHMDE